MLLQYQRSCLNRFANETQPLKQTQPAPMKSNVPKVAQQQQLSLYADKKMSTRQSTKKPAGKPRQVRALDVYTLLTIQACQHISSNQCGPVSGYRQTMWLCTQQTLQHFRLQDGTC